MPYTYNYETEVCDEVFDRWLVKLTKKDVKCIKEMIERCRPENYNDYRNSKGDVDRYIAGIHYALNSVAGWLQVKAMMDDNIKMNKNKRKEKNNAKLLKVQDRRRTRFCQVKKKDRTLS